MAKKSYKSMDDFASASGVSRPTLSKYFDDPSQIKEVTRKRIEAALKKSHFEPNLFARHLNRKRTRNIGILVPTMSDPFYVQVVSLIELELREKGFWPVQISSHTRPELEAEAVRTLLSLKVAGAIVAPLGAGSRRSALERLRDAIPVVCFDNPADADLPYVGNDNAQSMAAIVQYLCRSGEPPIFLEIPHMTENAGERQAGYRATMARKGILRSSSIATRPLPGNSSVSDTSRCREFLRMAVFRAKRCYAPMTASLSARWQPHSRRD